MGQGTCPEQPSRLGILWSGSLLSSIDRFGRLAYPEREEVTNHGVPGSKRHGGQCYTENIRSEQSGWQANLEVRRK